MFKNWDYWFDLFWQQHRPDLNLLLHRSGAKIKDRNTLIKPWPYKADEDTTQEQFEVLCASDVSGWERYVEVDRT